MTDSIDQKVLAELTDSIGATSVSRIIRGFLEELDTQVVDIHSYLQAGQMEQIAALAHTLKSTTATFGATDLNAIATRIEQVASSEEHGTLVSLVDNLQECVSVTRSLYIPYTE